MSWNPLDWLKGQQQGTGANVQRLNNVTPGARLAPFTVPGLVTGAAQSLGLYLADQLAQSAGQPGQSRMSGLGIAGPAPEYNNPYRNWRQGTTQSSKSNNKGKGTGLANIPLNENDNLAGQNYDSSVTLPPVGGGNSGTFRPDTPGSSPSLQLGSAERPAPPPPPTAPVAPTGRNTSDPTGQSEAKGTQMGSRSASYEDVMAFLGPYASQFLPLNSSALPGTGPGQRQQTSEIPNKTITLDSDGNYSVEGQPKYTDEDGQLLPGFTRETVIGPNGVESTKITGPFQMESAGVRAGESGPGSQNYTTIQPDDPMFAKAFGQDLADKYKKPSYTTIQPDDPMFAKAFGQDLADKYNKPKDPKNSGTNWMNRSLLDNLDESARRSAAFLDAPDVLSGLKARDHLYNKYYASGQYHEIPEKGGKTEVSYDNADVRKFMNADIGSVAQQEALELLDSYKNRIKTGAAVAQNPMLNADEGKGKVTATTSNNQVSDFTENNAAPKEMVPDIVDTPYGGYVNGKPVDLTSRDTPRNLRYTLTPEEVDEGLANGTLDQMQSELRPLPQN